MRWFEITLTGQDSHSGTTPMPLRRNALIGAARMVERVDAIALAHAPRALGTVGLVDVKPISRDVIPGEVFFSVDFRHPEEDVLAGGVANCEPALQKLRAVAARLCDHQGAEPASGPVGRRMHRGGARGRAGAGLSHREMIAGASHDAAYAARVAPTAMIFVPSRDGISHNEAEFSSKEQCAAGPRCCCRRS